MTVRQDVKLRFTLERKDLDQVKSGIAQLEAGLTRALKVGAVVGAAAGAGLAIYTRRAMENIDALAKQADMLNLGTESLATYKVNASLAGVEAEKFSNALRKMITNIGDARDGTGEAADTLKQLGLNVDDLARMRADEQFEAIAAKINGLATQADKANAAARIFGERDGVKMLNLIQQMADGTGVTRAELEALGVALTRVDAAKVERANDAMEKAGLVSEGFANRLAVSVAPFVEAVGEAIFDAGVKSGGFKTEIQAAVVAGAKAFAFLADAAHLSASSIGAIFTSLGQTIGAGFAQLVAVVNGEFELARQIGNHWYADQVANWNKLANDPNATKYRDKINEIVAAIEAEQGQPGGPARPGTRPGQDPARPDAAAADAHAKALKALQDELRGVGDEEGKAAQRRALLNELYAKGRISGEVYRDELAQMAGAYDTVNEAQASAVDGLSEGLAVFADQAARNIQDATATLLKGEAAFDNFAENILATLRNIAAELAAQQLLRALFSGLAGSSNPVLAAVGRAFTAKASGGYVSGPGGPRDDRVPALLSNGEYVIQASVVRKLGKGFFDALNSGVPASPFPRSSLALASGGMVGGGGSAIATAPGPVIQITNHVDARNAQDPAQVARAIEASRRQTLSDVSEMLQRGQLRAGRTA